MEAQVAAYFHIPFCLRKCSYCDFYSEAVGPAVGSGSAARSSGRGDFEASRSEIDDYLRILLREFGEWAALLREDGKTLGTVYFGGGTPTVIGRDRLCELVSSVLDGFVPGGFAPGGSPELTANETTVEANPGSGLSPQFLSKLRSCGVNRLSLGFQSLKDSELRKLGRIHTAREAIEAYEAAREAGFENISVDLMFGFPGQSLQSWRETLSEVVSIKPEHISCYWLSIEPGTLFGKAWAVGMLDLPHEDEQVEMYYYAMDYLADSGYIQYEISNFCLPGFECMHNQVYWMNREYLGAGASAHSFYRNRRVANPGKIEEYMEGPRAPRLLGETERLRFDDIMDETMMLGLRLLKGVEHRAFSERFGVSALTVYGKAIDKLVDRGMLECDDMGIRLTRRALPLGNQVFGEFLRSRLIP